MTGESIAKNGRFEFPLYLVPLGWISRDFQSRRLDVKRPGKAAWLNAMSQLTSSVPVAPPLVRIWLVEECQLVEVHRSGGTEAGESEERQSKYDVKRVPPGGILSALQMTEII